MIEPVGFFVGSNFIGGVGAAVNGPVTTGSGGIKPHPVTTHEATTAMATLLNRCIFKWLILKQRLASKAFGRQLERPCCSFRRRVEW